MSELPTPDALFHQPVRTRLAILLNQKPRSFSQLKTALKITDGNLDAHLRKLSSAGFLHSEMVLEGRPHTVYSLSSTGEKAFVEYVSVLKRFLKAADTEK